MKNEHRYWSKFQMTKELFRLPLLWTSPEKRGSLQKRMCTLTKPKNIQEFIFDFQLK